MRKLCTPQQYGYTLEELNDLRPLQVDDKVRQVICIPTLNELADSSKKSALGKLVKGTQHGHTLVKNVQELTEYELIPYDINGYDDILLVSFSQYVHKVLVDIKQLGSSVFIRWSDSIGVIVLRDFYSVEVHSCNISGNSMYIRIKHFAGTHLLFDVYGFY